VLFEAGRRTFGVEPSGGPGGGGGGGGLDNLAQFLAALQSLFELLRSLGSGS
jgi:hypothetical protein